MRYYSPTTDEVLPLPKDSVWLIPLYEEPRKTPNTSFDGNFQFVWDSVSLTALKRCARYYNWTVRHGYHLHPQPATLGFGIAFHSCMETWHKLTAQGMDKPTALLRCVRLAGLLGEYLTPGRTERTKETLIRAVVWYLDQFRDDNATTTMQSEGKPAVEFSFMVPLTEIAGTQTYLAGHLDRVVEFMGQTFVCDYKTTHSQLNEKFFASFKPNTQVQGYLAAAHIIGGTCSAIPDKPAGLIIDGIQLGVNYNRFLRSIIKYSSPEINDFLQDLEVWLRTAALYAEKEHWPANEESCDKYGGCVFRSICASTPPKRQRMLDADFVQSTWDPRKPR